MTLNELQQNVYALTNRPDLVAETLTAIKAATLRAHHSDFYFRDLYEVPLIFDTSDFQQSLDYSTLIPRYRAIKYLRKYDATTDTPGDFFTKVLPEQVIDGWNIHREDIFYVAGALIQIRSSTEFQHALAAFYLHPDITEASYDSWIAREHPFAIIYDATATIFKTIGYDEQYSRYESMRAEQIALVRITGLTEVGY